jgi:hypothetical protein
VDRLAVAIGQVDRVDEVDQVALLGHLDAPISSTQQPIEQKVSRADATISSARAPRRTKSSSQPITNRHLVPVLLPSPTKNESP